MRLSRFLTAAAVALRVGAAPATNGEVKEADKRSDEYTRREKSDARDAGSTTKYFREFLLTLYFSG
jgi:hypothetical protein